MKTITNIVYNFVRKQLAKNNMGQGKGITSLPNAADIEIGMTDVYNNLRKGGLDAVSAGKAIKSEDDLARTLSEIKQKEISDQQFFNQDPNRLDTIMDKMNKGLPLNEGDRFALEGSGFKTDMDAFKGFEPKVIQGGKSKGIEKLLESGDVKKGVAPKTTKETIKRKSMIDPKLTEEENIKKIMEENKAAAKRLEEKMKDPDKKAEGGLMRLGMFAGGTPLRRLLQYLAGTSGKKGSENLKDLNVSDQLKFFAEKQGFSPDQAKIEYLEQVLDTLKKDRDLIKSVEPSATKNELENMASKAFRESFVDMTQSGRFKGLTSDMIDKSILETETILKNLKTGGRKPNAEGGLMRLGFEKGSPPSKSRRNFLKLMGGLAALPVVGRFFKPAAKVAETAGPVVQEGVKLGYDKFLMLVDKIKRLGRPADNLATKERERVIRYDGKDGNEYELVEDLTTGDIRVTKDKVGVGSYNDRTFDTIEDRSTFVFKKGEDIVDTKTGKGKEAIDEYEEMREVASTDGTFGDIDEVSDTAVKEVLEELAETKIKKAGGGLAYMLGM